MPYLLDANVFIQAKNLHYGLDFCPAFWDWLIAGNTAKEVFSIEKVEDEILAVADELATWASKRGPDFFLKPDVKLLSCAKLGQRLGSGSKLRASSGQHVSSGRGLLPGRPRACSRAHSGNARDRVDLDEEDQDPRCVHCARH